MLFDFVSLARVRPSWAAPSTLIIWLLLLCSLPCKSSAAILGSFTVHERKSYFDVKQNNDLLYSEPFLGIGYQPNGGDSILTSDGTQIDFAAIGIAEGSPVHSSVSAGITEFVVSNPAFRVTYSASALAAQSSRYQLDYGEYLIPAVGVGWSMTVDVKSGEEVSVGINAVITPFNHGADQFRLEPINVLIHKTFTDPGTYQFDDSISTIFPFYWYRRAIGEFSRPFNPAEYLVDGVRFDLYAGVGVSIIQRELPTSLVAEKSASSSSVLNSGIRSANVFLTVDPSSAAAEVPAPTSIAIWSMLGLIAIRPALRKFRRC